MSVRAYKIITKETAEDPSFNLWQDGDLIEFFQDNGDYIEHLDDGGGTIEIEVKAIKEAIKNYKWEEDAYRPTQLAEDIKGLADDEFVEYECF